MIKIDGSKGEGGGQILRSSLALSLITGQGFQIRRIRAGRRKPGLLRQHLTAVRAAAEIGGAELSGDELGSQELSFQPGPVRPGSYSFAVGTAGSAGLVLQSVLPALLRAEGPSELTLRGGTHNPSSPPFDFLERAYAPWVRRLGPQLELELHQAGFYPAGGGHFTARVEPVKELAQIEVMERGELLSISARALVHMLPGDIARQEIAFVQEKLNVPDERARIEALKRGRGPGNALVIDVVSEHVTEVVTSFGEKGLPSDQVARRAVGEVRAYLGSDAPIGPHLADQLVLLMALAGGGAFRTARPTLHTLTNVETIRRFLDVSIALEEEDADLGTVLVRVG